MKFYKVVSEELGGRLASMVAQGALRRWYRPGKWTRASEWLLREGYGLLVFTDLESARDHLFYGKDQLWEVMAKDEDVMKLPSFLGQFPDTRASFLRVKMNNEGFLCWPENTAMVKKLKMIRRVM